MFYTLHCVDRFEWFNEREPARKELKTHAYRVGQKSNLLILREYVPIKLRRQEECEKIRTATEKKKHCLIFFNVKYFTSQSFGV